MKSRPLQSERGIDRENAQRILIALTHYKESGVGDTSGFAFGDFRVIFQINPHAIVIVRV